MSVQRIVRGAARTAASNRLWLAGLLLGVAPLSAASPSAVNESARQIPLAAEADVVVVGGSTGAVSAAVEAARQGAKVFLVAPHNYLGDDMTATLRLWLEPGEKPSLPLAKQLYHDPLVYERASDPNRLDYTYRSDVPSDTRHADTDPPALLSDRAWGDSSHDSVQYNGNATIVADLQTERRVAGVRVMVYQRDAEKRGSPFRVAKITVSVSSDQKSWQQVAVLQNATRSVDDGTVTLFAPLTATARYLKLALEKDPHVKRMVLGEIEILAPAAASPQPAGEPAPRPFHVKKTLDDALLAAGVQYLYGCYATDVLRDGQGALAGIVIANRAGRQAIVAKTIIDASDRASVARLAGARFQAYPAGVHTFHRVVIGGEVRNGAELAARTILPPFRGAFPNAAQTASSTFPIIDYTLRLSMPDAEPDCWAAADQRARTLTYHPRQQFTSDALFEVPPDAMAGRQTASGPWPGAGGLPLSAFQPAAVSRLYVLGGCADLPRDQAEKLLRPLALMEVGVRIGQAAAREAQSLPSPTAVQLPGATVVAAAAPGEVREVLAGVRPGQTASTIPQAARALPVLGRYDVVVIGGGTAGAPAGIAAARQKAKTLVVEYLSGLGGVGTTGAISKYFAGNRVGFVASVPGGTSWVIEEKMEWYRSELLKAGADIWFGCLGCGALVDGDKVTGAIVATPQGRGVVLAKVVIDTTGNADIAAAAGAPCVYTDDSEFAMQGTGLPPRNLGATYKNSDFTFVDETDMVDVWHVLVYAKQKYPTAFDLGQLVDTRERRRIVGDFTFTILDEVLARTYPDTICVAQSIYDTHGYTVDPYLMLQHPEKNRFRFNVPYRCLLPQGMEGILVGGLGMSLHRDASPLMRQQVDEMNVGYAAGVAAAMAAQGNTLLRHIDLRALQQHLIQIGNLPESVLTDRDSIPMSADQIAAAVAEIQHDFHGSAVILAHPQQSLPLLRTAYAQAAAGDKLNYAEVLAMLGDATGLETLLSEVGRARQWDEGWRYRGGGQFGEALSRLDKLVMALGRTRDRRALPAIVEKLKLLTAESAFSHHRAAALALEMIGDPAAAPALAESLNCPGIRGFAHVTLDVAVTREISGSTTTVQTRSDSLRELMLARALYRCGDQDGLGEKTLREYAQDLRGHLARHAQGVLAVRPRSPQ